MRIPKHIIALCLVILAMGIFIVVALQYQIVLPDWLTPALIISICLLVAAIVGVAINYRKSKPGLQVKVTRCVHSVRYVDASQKNEIAGTQLTAEFRVDNRGEKTSIYNVEIKCNPTEKPYQTTEKIQTVRAITIDRGETKTFSHQFYIPRRGVFEVQLECTFFLHHTYGKKKVKTKSNLHGEPNGIS